MGTKRLVTSNVPVSQPGVQKVPSLREVRPDEGLRDPYALILTNKGGNSMRVPHRKTDEGWGDLIFVVVSMREGVIAVNSTSNHYKWGSMSLNLRRIMVKIAMFVQIFSLGRGQRPPWIKNKRWKTIQRGFCATMIEKSYKEAKIDRTCVSSPYVIRYVVSCVYIR